jgi:flagellar protein FlaG
MTADLTILPGGQRVADTSKTSHSDARTPAAAEEEQAAVLKAPPQDVSPTVLNKAVDAANDHLKQIDSELAFQLDQKTGIVVVKLIDRKTNEVLRQVPSKEALAIARALSEGPGPGKIVKADA